MGTKAVASAITAIAVAALLAAPAGLEAKGRRGDLIILTKVDGAPIRGELISVRPESLLVRSGGEAFTIPRPKIQSVTILRRSRTASGALTGFTIGAALGIAWGIARGPDPIHGHPAIPAGAVGGGLGLIIGLATSRGEKVESVVALAGLAGPAADEKWNTLRARSREGRRGAAARRP
jgi:hypothetical protein